MQYVIGLAVESAVTPPPTKICIACEKIKDFDAPILIKCVHELYDDFNILGCLEELLR